MKIITITLMFYLLGLYAYGQTTHKGLPLLKANSTLADYKIGDDLMKGVWTISPQIESDSLPIACHSDREVFTFYTDLDSIVFNLVPGEVHSFYVSTNDSTYAHTVVKGYDPHYTTLQFADQLEINQFNFWYEQNNNNPYLNLLRSKHAIDSLINTTETDTERVLKILNWVHKQWKHNGNNVPAKSDAISILEEVGQGKNFRCVEYGIVATACLNAVGLKSRTLSLKTKDVEIRPYGAGHVLLEVFLNDLKKWVLIDAQWDAMPVLNGIPLNAVEFQKAISENYDVLEIRTSSLLSKRKYVDWIYPYLYYYSIAFDNREGTELEKNKINGKSALMLVPLGASNPTIFQINNKIDNCLYTNSLYDFYGEPQ